MIQKGITMLVLSVATLGAQVAQTPPWVYSTVAVCTVRQKVKGDSVVAETTAIGTATLISDGRYAYAATARHVVRGLDSVYLSLNLVNGKTTLLKIGGSQRYNFIFPEDTMLDLSLTMVAPPKGAIAAVFDVSSFANPAELVQGNEVRVVGFPVSVGVSYRVPIVKFGMVSAAPDASGYYYIDSNVFPGNSGGAVIIPPGMEIMPGGFQMSSRSTTPRLAGIVVGYLPYRDTAVSIQTRKPRVIFEENSGITQVVTPQALINFLQKRR